MTLGCAAHRLRDPGGSPQRLVWCLPMRTFVEQAADAAKEWFAKLAGDIVSEGYLPSPEDVHVLMGGVDADGWLDKPERPAVLVGTQDMLLSRALMRGYVPGGDRAPAGHLVDADGRRGGSGSYCPTRNAMSPR